MGQEQGKPQARTVEQRTPGVRSYPPVAPRRPLEHKHSAPAEQSSSLTSLQSVPVAMQQAPDLGVMAVQALATQVLTSAERKRDASLLLNLLTKDALGNILEHLELHDRAKLAVAAGSTAPTKLKLGVSLSTLTLDLHAPMSTADEWKQYVALADPVLDSVRSLVVAGTGNLVFRTAQYERDAKWNVDGPSLCDWSSLFARVAPKLQHLEIMSRFGQDDILPAPTTPSIILFLRRATELENISIHRGPKSPNWELAISHATQFNALAKLQSLSIRGSGWPWPYLAETALTDVVAGQLTRLECGVAGPFQSNLGASFFRRFPRLRALHLRCDTIGPSLSSIVDAYPQLEELSLQQMTLQQTVRDVYPITREDVLAVARLTNLTHLCLPMVAGEFEHEVITILAPALTKLDWLGLPFIWVTIVAKLLKAWPRLQTLQFTHVLKDIPVRWREQFNSGSHLLTSIVDENRNTLVLDASRHEGAVRVPESFRSIGLRGLQQLPEGLQTDRLVELLLEGPRPSDELLATLLPRPTQTLRRLELVDAPDRKFSTDLLSDRGLDRIAANCPLLQKLLLKVVVKPHVRVEVKDIDRLLDACFALEDVEIGQVGMDVLGFDVGHWATRRGRRVVVQIGRPEFRQRRPRNARMGRGTGQFQVQGLDQSPIGAGRVDEAPIGEDDE